MRSVIDRLSEFYSQKRNPFLRLSEADRIKLAIRTAVFLVADLQVRQSWKLQAGSW